MSDYTADALSDSDGVRDQVEVMPSSGNEMKIAKEAINTVSESEIEDYRKSAKPLSHLPDRSLCSKKRKRKARSIKCKQFLETLEKIRVPEDPTQYDIYSIGYGASYHTLPSLHDQPPPAFKIPTPPAMSRKRRRTEEREPLFEKTDETSDLTSQTGIPSGSIPIFTPSGTESEASEYETETDTWETESETTLSSSTESLVSTKGTADPDGSEVPQNMLDLQSPWLPQALADPQSLEDLPAQEDPRSLEGPQAPKYLLSSGVPEGEGSTQEQPAPPSVVVTVPAENTLPDPSVPAGQSLPRSPTMASHTLEEDDYVVLGFEDQRSTQAFKNQASQEDNGEQEEQKHPLLRERRLSYKALLEQELGAEDAKEAELGLGAPVEGFFSAEKMRKIGICDAAPVDMFQKMSLDSPTDPRHLPSSPFRHPCPPPPSSPAPPSPWTRT